MNNNVKTELNNEQLEKVSGGSWGHNNIHNENEYKAAGVTTDWSDCLFICDKFYFHGKEISDDEATAIVFFKYTHDRIANNVEQARNYKTDNVEAYKEFLKNVNS